MSRETTFDRDLHAKRDRAELGDVFTQLCTQVAADLARKGYVGRTIGIKLRFDDFKTVTRDQSIAVPTCDPAEIRQRRRPVPEARRPDAPAAAAGRARGRRCRAPARRRPRAARAKSGGQASTAAPKKVEDERPDEPTLF